MVSAQSLCFCDGVQYGWPRNIKFPPWNWVVGEVRQELQSLFFKVSSPLSEGQKHALFDVLWTAGQEAAY